MPRTMRCATTGVAAALSLLLGPTCVAAQELSDVADRAQASVVSIAAERTDRGGEDQDGDADARSNDRRGTGMVLSADGYVVTTTSLVDKAGKITVAFSDGKQATAQVTGRDPHTGVALLKVSATAPLTAVRFADAHVLRRGAPIFSIGYVYGLPNSLSSGVVAAVRRGGGPVVHLVLQTDMFVFPGSRGAPLFNMKGEVLGMFTGNYANGGKRTGVGLAVTSNLIREVTEKLQKFGVVERGWLGVQTRKPTDEEASALGVDKGSGLIIIKLIEGGPAATAGFAVGDALTTFNGQPISDRAGLGWNVTRQAPNTEVMLGVVRKDTRSDVRVKLGRLADPQTTTSSTSATQPAPSPDDKSVSCLRYVPSVGLTVAIACEE